jgi:hypothetical protein
MNFEIYGPFIVAALPSLMTYLALRQQASKNNADTAEKWQAIAGKARDRCSECETKMDELEKQLDAVANDRRRLARYVEKLKAQLVLHDLPIPEMEKTES